MKRIACLLGAAAIALPLTSTAVHAQAAPRVVIIGFDGADAKLTRQWMDEGKLPNLKKLADNGTFATLASSQPSESPTAWSSFATGANPGKHNIYDFLVRNVDTYLPDLGMVKKEPPEFKWGFFPVKPPKVTSIRGGGGRTPRSGTGSTG